MSIDRIRFHVIPVVILTLFSFVHSLATRFTFFSRPTTPYGHDAGIFAYIGYAMQNGKILYTQVWDNKGPLLYVINWLGVSINYYHGIYVLELIALLVTALFSYRLALLITKRNRVIATCATMFSMSLLVVTLEGGNLSEEYALPFISIALFYAAKYFYNQLLLKWYEFVIIGCCFAAVLLLRANICAVFIPLFVVVCIARITHRQAKQLLVDIGWVLAGVALFLIPFIVYLWSNGALGRCVADAYMNALGDFEPISKLTHVSNTYKMISKTMMTGAPFVVVLFMITYLAVLRKRVISSSGLRAVLAISFWGLLVNLLANSLSGAMQMHYFITFVPILVPATAWLLVLLFRWIHDASTRFKSLAGNIVTIAVVLLIGMQGFSGIVDKVMSTAGYERGTQGNEVYHYVLENSEPDDLIQVFGEDVTLNYRTQRHAASSYVVLAPGRFSQKMVSHMANEIARDLEANPPKLILFGSDSQYERFVQGATLFDVESFLADHYDKQVVDFDFIVYMAKPIS